MPENVHDTTFIQSDYTTETTAQQHTGEQHREKRHRKKVVAVTGDNLGVYGGSFRGV